MKSLGDGPCNPLLALFGDSRHLRSIDFGGDGLDSASKAVCSRNARMKALRETTSVTASQKLNPIMRWLSSGVSRIDTTRDSYPPFVSSTLASGKKSGCMRPRDSLDLTAEEIRAVPASNLRRLTRSRLTRYGLSGFFQAFANVSLKSQVG